MAPSPASPPAAAFIRRRKTPIPWLNRRYRERLRRPVPARLVSIVLRRMLDAGSLRSIREGRPHHEALYAKP
jgi:hypothetical protein